MRDSNSRFNYILKEGDNLFIPKIKDLVGIAGRINHPHIKNESEIDEINLKLELMKLESAIAKEELLAERKIKQMRNPHRISVPFHERKNAFFYLKEYAGGIDRANGGRKRLIYVQYPNGAVQKTRTFLWFHRYPKVDKGAIVFVDTHTKEKNIKNKANRTPIDWNKIIRDVLSLGTSALMIYGIIKALQ